MATKKANSVVNTNAVNGDANSFKVMKELVTVKNPSNDKDGYRVVVIDKDSTYMVAVSRMNFAPSGAKRGATVGLHLWAVGEIAKALNAFVNSQDFATMRNANEGSSARKVLAEALAKKGIGPDAIPTPLLDTIVSSLLAQLREQRIKK